MVRTHIIYDDGRMQVDESIALAKSPPSGATVWVDVTAAADVGLNVLLPEWGFHPLALEDCRNHQRRAKYDRYPSHSFLVLHALDHDTVELLDTVAVRVFIRPGLVVSFHDRPVAAVDKVDKICLKDTERIQGGPERVVHALMDAMIDEFIPLLDAWEHRLDEIATEEELESTRSTVTEVIRLRRNFLIMRRIMLPQLEVARRLRDNLDAADPARHHYQDVVDHIEALLETASLCVEVVVGWLQMQSDRSNDRLNKVMKYLSVVSTLLLPMTVISGVFGMNFDVIPTAHDAHGFWAAIAMMATSAAALMGWFRYKRWF